MNEEDILFDEEDILEDTSLDDDTTLPAEGDTIEHKLDRIEALLNEDIALRTSEDNEDQAESLVEDNVTGSGAIVEPNYNQYIYDLLTDSTVKVEVVQQENEIMNKPFKDYSVSESLLVIVLIVLLAKLVYEFIEAHVFKRR